MKIFTLSSEPKKMGDKDEKYGQRYWAEVSEQLEPVMFNSMKDHIPVGAKLVAEESENKVSAKGTQYVGLRKVKVSEPDIDSPFAQTEVAPKQAPDAVQEQLNRIEEKIDKLLGTDEELTEDSIPY